MADPAAPELRAATKQMLLEPSSRIQLDDLVTAEVRRLVSHFADPGFADSITGSTNNEVEGYIAARALEASNESQPFLGSLQVAARHANPEDLAPWVHGITALVDNAYNNTDGNTWLTPLRNLPAAFAVLTAAVSATVAGRWANLKALVVDPYIIGRHVELPLSILEATDPHRALNRYGGFAEAILAYATRAGIPIDDIVADLDTGKVIRPKGSEPFEAAANLLRPLFDEYVTSDSQWRYQFIHAEAFLAVLVEDLTTQARTGDGNSTRSPISHWYGLAANRHFRSDGGPAADLGHEFDRDGARWGPLTAGLFGGSPDRARAAIDRYAVRVDEASSRRSF